MTHAQKNFEQLRMALDEDEEAIPERIRERVRERIAEAEEE